MRGMRLVPDGDELVECRRHMRHADAHPYAHSNAYPYSHSNAYPYSDTDTDLPNAPPGSADSRFGPIQCL